MNTALKVIKVLPILLIFFIGITSRSVATDVCKNRPKLTASAQKRTSLFLPTSVRGLLHATLPDLSVPDQTDLKGLWATEAKPGSLPYFEEGDFNGDGRRDFTILLRNAKEFWLVILHGESGCNYTIGYKLGPYTDIDLQKVFLRVVPKGQEEVTSGNETSHYKFDTDAIEITIVDRSVGVFYWKDGKYQTLDFGSE